MKKITLEGKIEGEFLSSSGGRQFASFNGIPYARPPVGTLRFLKPQPAESWPGVRKCVKNVTFIQLKYVDVSE